MPSHEIQRRIIGSLKGIATGDAIGKQTENLARTDILRWYPNEVQGFEGAPGTVIPRYEHHPRYSWRVGETTDDTEQTISIAQSFLTTGSFDHTDVGQALFQCTKSCHPPLSFWHLKESQNPSRVCFEGPGCGAAMRVAPVGMVYSSERLASIVSGAFECCIPTHGDQAAICGAAAIAAAVSAAIDGRPEEDILELSIQAAKEAEKYRQKTLDWSISDSIQSVYEHLSTGELNAHTIAQTYTCKQTPEIIPMAIALALLTKSAEQTALLATNIGGDTDSVASMGSAIAGAINPDSVNDEWYRVVSQVNGIDMDYLGEQLASFRT